MVYKSKEEMNSRKNMILHGLYLGLYGFVKYLPFPFFYYFRYFVIKLFAPNIKSKSISDGVTIYFPWNVKLSYDEFFKFRYMEKMIKHLTH